MSSDCTHRASSSRSALVSEPVRAGNGVGWIPLPQAAEAGCAEWLMGGFSTRIGGRSTAYAAPGAPAELNLGFTADDARETVLENRCLLSEAVSGSPETPLLVLHQIHSATVLRISSADLNQQPPHQADGLISNDPGILIGVQTADCIPVLVADTKQRVVGAFHAGWRGTVQGIVLSGVRQICAEFGSVPEDMIAAIGPGVGQCCYTVGDEVRNAFAAQFPYAEQLFRRTGDGALQLDLIEANRRQLLDAGLHPESIQIAGGCTHCHQDLFFSHRGSQGRAGRMLSVIGIRA